MDPHILSGMVSLSYLGADYAHFITNCPTPPPDFQTFLRPSTTYYVVHVAWRDTRLRRWIETLILIPLLCSPPLDKNLVVDDKIPIPQNLQHDKMAAWGT